MNYTTIQAMIDVYGSARLIDLTDRAEPATGEINQTVANQAIADAQAMIDGYVSARYGLPMVDVPALIRVMVGKIAYYLLHIDMVPEKVKADYDGAVRMLRDIADGRVKLDIAGVEPISAPTRIGIDAPERIFTADFLRDF